MMIWNSCYSVLRVIRGAYFKKGLKGMDVAPDSMLLTGVDVGITNITQIAPYFDELYNNSIFSNAMVKLNGTLTVGLYSVRNETSTKVYYCWPLTIGAAGNASTPGMDENVPCVPDNDPTK